MKVLDHSFRLKKTETSFGTFGHMLVELEDSDTQDVDMITKKQRSDKMAMKDKMTVAEISEFFGVSETAVLNWEKQKNGIKRIEDETPITFKTDDVFSYAQEEQIIQPNALTRKSPKSVSYKATTKIDESCPLCKKYDPVIDLGDDNLFRVVCQLCHHQGVGMPSADEAIREWNRSARYYRNISMEKSRGCV